MKLSLFIFLVLLTASLAQAIEPCQLHLFRLLGRLPPESTRTYWAREATDVKQLNFNSPELKPLSDPKLRATVFGQGDLYFSIVGTDTFQTLLEKTNQHGFWLFYTPASEADRNPVGHLSLSVNGTYFTGQWAMVSLKGVNARLDSHPYVVAQFFETSPESARLLEKFLHDRVWFFHQKHPDYRSEYVVLPFSRDAHVECGENCVNSNLSFLEQKWIERQPELERIRNELGKMMVSEIPNRQVWLSTQSPAYRGTVIVTHNPAEAEHWMTQGDFNSSHTGKQLLLDGPSQKLR